jgi:predicted lactoylglutathione lyase
MRQIFAVADAKSTSEVLLALSCASDREVDDLVVRHMRSEPR